MSRTDNDNRVLGFIALVWVAILGILYAFYRLTIPPG